MAAAATEGGVAEAAAPPPKFDGSALVKYAAAISIQVGLLGGGLAAVDFAAGLFPTLHLPTPLTKALTGLLFGSLALKSRIASPLNNRRPDREAAMKNTASAGFRDRIMPSWTPPGEKGRLTPNFGDRDPPYTAPVLRSWQPTWHLSLQPLALRSILTPPLTNQVSCSPSCGSLLSCLCELSPQHLRPRPLDDCSTPLQLLCFFISL